jgi:hypothetical protein
MPGRNGLQPERSGTLSSIGKIPVPNGLQLGARQDGGATLEAAITISVEEILGAHGLPALTGEEFEAYFADLPSDGEG